MKEQDIIKAVAELDGKEKHHQFKCSDPWDGDCDICGGKAPSELHEVPDYLTSYDAILPVIQKQTSRVKVNVEDWIEECPTMETPFWYDATPAQLCEALLRATGKWIE